MSRIVRDHAESRNPPTSRPRSPAADSGRYDAVVMQFPFIGRWATERSERQALRLLERADTLAFHGVGIAGIVLRETEAFRMVAASKQLADHEPELRRLIHEATPAGRIYAACLLAKLRPRDKAVWQPLLADTAPVVTGAGCIMETVSVRTSAERLMHARPAGR